MSGGYSRGNLWGTGGHKSQNTLYTCVKFSNNNVFLKEEAG